MPDKPRILPPDNAQRERALDVGHSILVRAPAGSGKTDLLTRRFLSLLGEVNHPGEIVAITFTNAAAAEMRHRILSELEIAAAASDGQIDPDPFSMLALANRALARSQALGWNLVDLPAQLRVSTIDSFCRDLASQEPILSGLGGNLEIQEQPEELYRIAARRTLEQIGRHDAALSAAIETLLLWRDNHWSDLEDQLVAMLSRRDQWMHNSLLDRDPDWIALREQLERPFARAMSGHLASLSHLFALAPGALDEAHRLARFACEQSGGRLHSDLAELADFPAGPFATSLQLEEAHRACLCLADLLLTADGKMRRQVNVTQGFPKECQPEKARMHNLLGALAAIPGFAPALQAVRGLPSLHYSDEDWEIVRACFILLRHAAGQLRVVFAETAMADFIEVAQVAQRSLKGDDNLPSDAAQAFADGIHHLLIDEFQDTSRRQHQLLATLIAAWSSREGRTCFVVGDPMQSIYGFRDADAELFPRVEQLGLEIPADQPLLFHSVQLVANFRSAASLVDDLNRTFTPIFAVDDGSGIDFTPAQSAQNSPAPHGPRLVADSIPSLRLHLEFMPATPGGARRSDAAKEELRFERNAALQSQLQQIVDLVRRHLPQIETARAAGEKFRVAVLGRARNALAPVAQALRQAQIPFRAVELEDLRDRPEIIDSLALAQALLNPANRVAWLSVLRAPWCGLSLAELHLLVSADDPALLSRPVPDLLAERVHLLGSASRAAVTRLIEVMAGAADLRRAQPTMSLGTWLEQIWLRLGGAQCVDAAARANLDLLWRRIDDLPQGEPDLLGPPLRAALAHLKALPDPAASADCGVQLMTMHGAKGLEFEVVILPELQAPSRANKSEMLVWLERGLPPDADHIGPGEITEFLVAPFPPKGAEPGPTKAWVNRVRRDREKQEMRRILYVAATRARDELHVFARPSYRARDSAQLELADPGPSLLLTGWPAWEPEIRRQFAEWSAARASAAEPVTIESIAASRDSASAIVPTVVPAVVKPARLRRLPPDLLPVPAPSPSPSQSPLLGAGTLFERHEGGLLSRIFGQAVHATLQQLALHRAVLPLDQALVALAGFVPRMAAQIRAAGVSANQASQMARQALELARKTATDAIGAWIVSPHAQAASEVRWTGIVDGNVRTVQVDRVFLAGPAPNQDASPAGANTGANTSANDGENTCPNTGENTWWIVDFKTVHPAGFDSSSALPALRRAFAPQVEAYARILRNLHGPAAQICAGLYYPRMALFDFWKI